MFFHTVTLKKFNVTNQRMFGDFRNIFIARSLQTDCVEHFGEILFRFRDQRIYKFQYADTP